MKVKFGIDVLLANADGYLHGNPRIGLVCNKASVTQNGMNSRLALHEAGFNLTMIFGPEHGFDASGADGDFIHNDVDELTQLPIVSLYSDKLAPTEDDLANIDLMVVDLPDIGARFYTYLWTMTYVLESCEKHNKPVLLLDRPNPIASTLDMAEGPLLVPHCASFIGRYAIPINHQCTFAELALYFKHYYYPALKLKVVKMENWSREANTDYDFQPTSPAIQSRAVTYIYPGSCLFEGLNINEGRGSTHPFEQFAAPWIDNELLAEKVAEELGAAALVEKVSYTPTFGFYEQEQCYGLKIIPKEQCRFKAVAYFVKLIQIIYHLYPTQLKERNYITNANPNGSKHLDKLLGIPHAFEKIITGKVDTSLNNWNKETMKPFLLY